jgi:hypothetical protein
MSHFSVLVLGDNVEAQLAPYHEFECTGKNDQYVQDVDITEEVRKLMTEPRGYGEQKDEPYDLNDALDYYGLADKVVEDESSVDRDDEHKYGFAIILSGELIKAVDRTNPNKKWDWYVLGGRYTGRLRLRPGAKGETGRPGLMTENASRGYVDQALKRDIDFDAMRDEREGEARATYRRFYRLIEGHEFPKTWASVREAHAGNIDAARAAYHAQPAIQAIKDDDEFRWSDDVAFQFGCTEDEYAQRARNRACGAFAVVKDSQWYEHGRMGWWGMVSDEKDDGQWYAEVAKLLDSVGDDTQISIVDCHI